MGCLEGHDFWVKLNFNNFVNAEFLGKISPQQSCLIMKLMGLIFTYEILRFIAFLMMVRPKTSDQNYIRVINNFPSGYIFMKYTVYVDVVECLKKLHECIG